MISLAPGLVKQFLY